MDSTKIIKKCSVVRTRFCIGLYLHVPSKIKKYKQISVQEGLRFEEALKIIKEEMGEQFEKIKFKFNRFYQITDKRIYTVLWDKYHVGFIETEKIADFINENNIKIRYVRTCECDYQKAVAMVTQLGAVTGKDKIFLSKSPLVEVWYRRNS